MMFGLTSEEFSLINRTLVQPLKAKGADVYCFGSRARGSHRKYSDLDLMVESPSKDGLDMELLLEKIQSSNFPYKVDLVHFGDFAESYKDCYLIERVPFASVPPAKE